MLLTSNKHHFWQEQRLLCRSSGEGFRGWLLCSDSKYTSRLLPHSAL